MALPPLRSIQVFEAVVRCGSVTAAADELDVSAGAISQQIRILETALGARMFERNGRSLEVTTWGNLYYEHIRFAFDHLQTAQATLQKARSRSGISLSALPSLAIRWLRPLLAEWQVKHPDCGVLLVGTEEEPTLSTERLDFRLTYGECVRRYGQYVELFTDRVVPACSPGFLARHRVRSAGDILCSTLIKIEWDVSQKPPPSWDDWGTVMGLEGTARTGLAFSLSSSAIDVAVHDGGFVLGQLSMIAEEVANGRLVVPIDVSLPMPEPYFLAWDRPIMDRPFGQSFKAFLTAAARRQAASGTLSGTSRKG